MACELLMQHGLVYGFLKHALPEDAIDMDLTVQTLNGIHMFREDYKSQTTNVALGELKCSPTHHRRRKWLTLCDISKT